MSRYPYGNKMSFVANKPEFALKRAQELMDMGNKEQALETLSVIAVGPKKQKIWSKKLELLVSKFCSLCVDLNRASKARDGLRAFKQISSQNPQSVELVVNEFLQAAERAIDQVKSDAYVEPLSKINLDPSLVHLIKGINIDEFTGQADKENVRPKLKFLFEAYIIALETLKNNVKLEGAFKNVAKQAFEYCCKYHRVSEFKRLTNPKNLTQSYVDSEETLTSQLEVKFAQLNASVILELWSEAHNAINDIYGTLHTTKAILSKDTYITYYAQLEKLLWVSKSFAPHAEALFKYSELKAERDRTLLSTVITEADPEVKAEKEKARDDAIAQSQNENKALYSRIMLAALCIPLNAKTDDPYCIFYDAQKEKEARLAALLNFEPRANRSALLRYLSEGEGSILDKCEASVVTLFKLLEVNVQPFVFAKEVNKHLATLSENPAYGQYCVTLQSISFVKLLQKLSTVYQSMEIVQLQKLFPSLTVQEIQKQAIFARGNGQVDCMIDHRREVINFSSVSLSSQDIRYKLSEISCNLRKCVALVDTPTEAELAKRRERVFKSIAAQIPGERQRLIERRQYIEKMKELREAEEAKNQKLAHERHVKAVAEAEKREAEKVRKAQEAANALKNQKLKEIEEKKRNEMLQQKLKEMAKNVGTTASDKISEQLEDHFESSEDFVKRQLAQIVAERKKKEKGIDQELQAQNHMIRAVRELEMPHRKEAFEKSLTNAKSAFEIAKEERAKKLELLQIQRSEAKIRLARVEGDFDFFKKKIDEEKEVEIQKKKKERDAKVQAWQSNREKQRQAQEAARRKQEEEEELRQRHVAEEREREAARREQEAKERVNQPSYVKPPVSAVGTQRPPIGLKPWEKPSDGSAKPTFASPFANKDASKPPTPFGNKPATVGQPQKTESPFGSAKPVSTGPTGPSKESPFGVAKPVSTGPTTSGPQKTESPFGSAKPVSTGPTGPSKESPFGVAKPVSTGPSNSGPNKESPFGGAKPVSTGPTTGGSSGGPNKPSFGGNAPSTAKPWDKPKTEQQQTTQAPTSSGSAKPWDKPKADVNPNPTRPTFGGSKPTFSGTSQRAPDSNNAEPDGWKTQNKK